MEKRNVPDEKGAFLFHNQALEFSTREEYRCQD